MFLNHSGTIENSKNEMNFFRGSYQRYTLFPYVAFADLKRNWIPGARPGALKNLARDGKLANVGVSKEIREAISEKTHLVVEIDE